MGTPENNETKEKVFFLMGDNDMKTKFINIMLLLALLTPAVVQASLVFTEDGEITSGTYHDATIMNTATVAMSGGSVDEVTIQNLGKLNFSNGTINNQIQIWDSGTLNLEGASFGGELYLNNSGVFNLNSGSIDGSLYGYDYSYLRFDGGQAPGVDLDMSSYSICDIYNGNLTMDSLNLLQYSEFNVYGGDLFFNTYVWLEDQAEINIRGGNILFGEGFSLNDEAKINVYYSSAIYDKPGGIIVGYHLYEDNSEFMLDQFTYSEIDQINFVPEPATMLLFGLGGLFLRRRS